MQVEVQIVNAFIDGDSGGNAAGVVVDADALSAAQKQAIARQVGLSETAFVSASNTATVKLEFFTPNRQIAHCGHATIATFSLLRQMGRVGSGRLSKETIDGKRDIVIDGDMTFMEQRAPRYQRLSGDAELGRRVLASLAISPAQLSPGASPILVSTGASFLIVPMADERSLSELNPDLALVESVSNELDLIGYYAYATTTKRPQRQAAARMFAPRFGIAEESATGMAAGPLACYLHDHAGVHEQRMSIEQGWLMQPPSPSVIQVSLELVDGAITRLMAGGKGRVMRTISVEI